MAFPGWAEKATYTPKPLRQNVISPERKAEFEAATREHFEKLADLDPNTPEWMKESVSHQQWLKDNGFSVTRRGLVDKRTKK